MICRDTLEYDEETPIPTRKYILQNWRADVIALTDSTGNLLERITYDPYGFPFATHPTDLTHSATADTVGYGTPNGVVNNDDYFYFLTLYGLGDWRADWNRDGVVDTDDHTAYFAEWTAATGSWGRGVLSNRGNILGYAGYVHEPATGAAGGGHGTMWHVRNRVLHSGLGRWVQRDPLEYVDGLNLYAYAKGSPLVGVDPAGTTNIEVRCRNVTPPLKVNIPRIPFVIPGLELSIGPMQHCWLIYMDPNDPRACRGTMGLLSNDPIPCPPGSPGGGPGGILGSLRGECSAWAPPFPDYR